MDAVMVVVVIVFISVGWTSKKDKLSWMLEAHVAETRYSVVLFGAGKLLLYIQPLKDICMYVCKYIYMQETMGSSL